MWESWRTATCDPEPARASGETLVRWNRSGAPLVRRRPPRDGATDVCGDRRAGAGGASVRAREKGSLVGDPVGARSAERGGDGYLCLRWELCLSRAVSACLPFAVTTRTA